MNQRFYIEKLIVTGQGVKEASLKFSKGANLIVGSSDTGKSYIYQCIDYLLGAGTCPKDIPESSGYTEAYLQIRTNENRVYTIFRSLKSASKAKVSETIYEKYSVSEKKELGEKNGTFDGENISEFLLNLMGVKDVSIKLSAANKTRKISYRDIARLTLIDESRIITEGSPVYTSMLNFTSLTGERSAFRYLLTGNYDNELVEKEEKKVFESRIKGKIEFIDALVLTKNRTIEDLQNSLSDLTSEEINLRVAKLLERLESSTKRIEVLTSKREDNFNELQKLKSSNLQNNELLKRFHLLHDHYKNDLNRLNFILEGEFLFKQLITKDCPVCGTHMDEEHLKCLANNKENKAIGESVKIEGQKIELKLKDLASTIAAAEFEKQKNDDLIFKLQSELESVNKELNGELIPLQQNFQTQISQLINFNKIEQDILTAKNDVTKLYLDKESLNTELKSKPKYEDAKVDLGYSILKAFASQTEKYLKAWKFPGLTTVEFNSDNNTFDLIISARGRNSHGKGVRALSYSAFTFGLLDFCLENSKPHSGFIVLDSPLTTYHNTQKREKDDEIAPDMQELFFKDLAKVKDDRQIIILDNKVPPSDVISKINYIQFSNEANSIRKGFFPI